MTSKVDWLARLRRGEETWGELVAQVGDNRMEQPGVEGPWSFRDLTCHLNGWREVTVDRLEAAALGVEPGPKPWPEGLDENTEEHVDAINELFQQRCLIRSTPELLAEARNQMRRIQAAVEAIPEDALSAPCSWLGGRPLTAIAQGTLEHLFEEHESAIRAWLARDVS